MAKLLRYIFWVALVVAALIFVLRLTAIRWWRVPTGDPYLEASIAPTLRGGDWLILWRATAPHAGDLALCPDPTAAGRQVIGRLLGMPGDHVKVAKNTVALNNTIADTTGSCDSFKVIDPGTRLEAAQGCAEEQLAEKTHQVALLRDNFPPPSDVEQDVREGMVFLLSDNRQFPWDSRDFGLVERSSCRETIVFRLVSKAGFFDVGNRFALIH